MQHITKYIFGKLPIYPLVTFRILFGVLMLFSTIRFWSKGWIESIYIVPKFHFTYYGFEWVKVLPGNGMYILFGILILCSICITLGLFYRATTTIFFLGFTYVELIDKTTYLNHYYFVSIVAFLLIFLPAHRLYSLDLKIFKLKPIEEIPSWLIGILIAQISIVYLYAGLAKINYDWLIEAQPIKEWIKPKYHYSFIGWTFRYDITAYIFSYSGLIFDCLVPFGLLFPKTRKPAYLLVVGFHLMTGWLFPIGVFPYVMIGLTTLFFSASTHKMVLEKLLGTVKQSFIYYQSRIFRRKLLIRLFCLHLLFQLLIPWRYLLYPGDLFWNEEGFRFSWRVMLIEKSGLANYYIKHPDYPGFAPIDNEEHLTPQQEKQMSFQPDFMIQYAHYLKEHYEGTTMIQNNDTIQLNNIEIRADIYVRLNGKASKKMIDKSVILSNKKYNLKHRAWLIPNE